jgi:hypothetical protein
MKKIEQAWFYNTKFRALAFVKDGGIPAAKQKRRNLRNK